MQRCPVCRGNLTPEEYYPMGGGHKTTYIRCIQCGRVWFTDKDKEEKEDTTDLEVIAKELGVSKQAVHKTYHRALSKLSSILLRLPEEPTL